MTQDASDALRSLRTSEKDHNVMSFAKSRRVALLEHTRGFSRSSDVPHQEKAANEINQPPVVLHPPFAQYKGCAGQVVDKITIVFSSAKSDTSRCGHIHASVHTP